MPLKYDDKGLIPAIVQDAENGEILMFAWMNEESVKRTQESRQAWFWSRSRQELWHKGATSGNTLDVTEVRYDCDEDVLLVKRCTPTARPATPVSVPVSTANWRLLRREKRRHEGRSAGRERPPSQAEALVREGLARRLVLERGAFLHVRVLAPQRGEDG